MNDISFNYVDISALSSPYKYSVEVLYQLAQYLAWLAVLPRCS